MNFWRYLITADLWRPEVASRWICLEIFAFFWKNDPLRWNFQNSVPKAFTASLIDVVVFKFREIWPTWNQRNRALFTRQKKFRLPLSLLRGSRQNLSRPALNNVLIVLQISSKLVHFRRSYSRTREDRQIVPYSESDIWLKLSFQPNKCTR